MTKPSEVEIQEGRHAAALRKVRRQSHDEIADHYGEIADKLGYHCCRGDHMYCHAKGCECECHKPKQPTDDEPCGCGETMCEDNRPSEIEAAARERYKGLILRDSENSIGPTEYQIRIAAFAEGMQAGLDRAKRECRVVATEREALIPETAPACWECARRVGAIR